MHEPVAGIPWGLNEKNLAGYTKAAIVKLLHEVHGIDELNFRMHEESGLTGPEMRTFWPEVIDILKRTVPKLRITLRAKGLPDAVIDAAVEKAGACITRHQS